MYVCVFCLEAAVTYIAEVKGSRIIGCFNCIVFFYSCLFIRHMHQVYAFVLFVYRSGFVSNYIQS